MRMLTLVVTPALARMASWLLPVICSAFSLRLVSSLSSTHWSLQASLSTLQESAELHEGPHSRERLQLTHIPSLKKLIHEHSQVVLCSKNCESKFVLIELLSEDFYLAISQLRGSGIVCVHSNYHDKATDLSDSRSAT